jgi:CBS domain containing-hemolysin-like protein
MHLAQKPNGFLATIQIGITLAGFPASATAAVSLAVAKDVNDDRALLLICRDGATATR